MTTYPAVLLCYQFEGVAQHIWKLISIQQTNSYPGSVQSSKLHTKEKKYIVIAMLYTIKQPCNGFILHLQYSILHPYTEECPYINL